MTDHGKATDNLLDTVLQYQQRRDDALRQMDLLQLIDPTLAITFDDLRERLRRP